MQICLFRLTAPITYVTQTYTYRMQIKLCVCVFVHSTAGENSSMLKHLKFKNNILLLQSWKRLQRYFTMGRSSIFYVCYYKYTERVKELARYVKVLEVLSRRLVRYTPIYRRVTRPAEIENIAIFPNSYGITL